jgi:hypothetical protein
MHVGGPIASNDRPTNSSARDLPTKPTISQFTGEWPLNYTIATLTLTMWAGNPLTIPSHISATSAAKSVAEQAH